MDAGERVRQVLCEVRDCTLAWTHVVNNGWRLRFVCRGHARKQERLTGEPAVARVRSEDE